MQVASCPGAESPDRPNVILIISDDQGFTDYGFMGHKQVQTPNLDRMASESLLYTRGYVMPMCSPSLACLLTGVMPHEHGITGNDLSGNRARRRQRDQLASHLLGNPVILPEAVSGAGYLSFQTGKLWNVTYKDAGFTHGMTDTAGRHGDAGLEIGRKDMKPVFDFIEMAQRRQKPFFIWHAPFMPHQPHNPPKKILNKYRGKGPTGAAEKYFAMVDWFDQTCGELDRYLEENRLKDNTVVVYLADNGWNASHGNAKGRAKLSPYELGIRTPIFVRWPGKVSPDRDDVTLAHILDIAPTILGITGAPGRSELPGLNLTDRAAMQSRERIFVEAYNHDISDLDSPAESLIARVVIDGWWKLVAPGPATPDREFATVPTQTALFDLQTDPLEKIDLADRHPAVVERLLTQLELAWDYRSPPVSTSN